MRQKLDQDKFCEQFMAAFCGTWCAINYDDACMTGHQKRIEKPPVEDAEYLADAAWARYVETVLKYK